MRAVVPLSSALSMVADWMPRISVFCVSAWLSRSAIAVSKVR